MVVHLEGVTLGAEQLCRLQNLPPHQHGLRRTPRAGPGLLSVYQACIPARSRARVPAHKRTLQRIPAVPAYLPPHAAARAHSAGAPTGAFAPLRGQVTDVPCVVSGDSLFLFDPLGTSLASAGPAGAGARPVGKANLFVNSELPQRFPDQFAPLRLFGFDPARRRCPRPGPAVGLRLRRCWEWPFVSCRRQFRAAPRFLCLWGSAGRGGLHQVPACLPKHPHATNPRLSL